MAFENCGNQIKALAIVSRWIIVLAGIILAFVGLEAMIYGEFLLLAIGISLIVSGWIISLLLYGFGIIVAVHETKLPAPAVMPVPENNTPIAQDSTNTQTAAPAVTPAPVAPVPQNNAPVTQSATKPQAATPAVKPTISYSQEDLEILRKLHQDGSISDEEYQQLIEKQAET